MSSMKTVGQRLREVGLDDQQTKEAVKVFLQYLPNPVDVQAKYEAQEGVHVTFTGSRAHDDAMLTYVANFAEDQGWNRYYYEFRQRLAGIPGSVDKTFNIGDHKGTQ
jgi:hypothetical protein